MEIHIGDLLFVLAAVGVLTELFWLRRTVEKTVAEGRRQSELLAEISKNLRKNEKG